MKEEAKEGEMTKFQGKARFFRRDKIKKENKKIRRKKYNKSVK